MKNKELMEKTEKELKMLLEEKKNKKEEACFKVATSGIKNVKEIKAYKKDIARILTIINKK
jgi:ribosomal protein L29